MQTLCFLRVGDLDHNLEDKTNLSDMRALPPQSCPGPREGFHIKTVFPNQKCEIPGMEDMLVYFLLD